MSRPQIAAVLGVSLPTAGALVKHLIASGLLGEFGRGQSRGGRPAQLVQLNPQYAHAVGLLVTFASVQAVAVNLAGEIVFWGETEPTDCRSVDAVLDQTARLTQTVVAKSPGLQVRGLGVAIAGVVDPDSRLVRTFPSVHDWRNVPFGELMAQRLGLPCEIRNNVQAATLAELHFGLGRQSQNVMYLHVFRGIGVGLISEGRLLCGRRGCAGELGHTVVEPDGPVCHCDNRGCLESVAGPHAIVRDAIAALKRGVDSTIAPADAADPITFDQVLAAANTSDPLAVELLAQAGRKIGLAVAGLANAVNPDVLVLGGLLAREPPVLAETIRRTFLADLMPAVAEEMTISVSPIRDLPACIGAATAVFDRLLAAKRGLIPTEV